MDHSQSEPGLAFIARLLLGTAVGAFAALRVYTCVNLIESGQCEAHDWVSGLLALVVLGLALWFLARTLNE